MSGVGDGIGELEGEAREAGRHPGVPHGFVPWKYDVDVDGFPFTLSLRRDGGDVCVCAHHAGGSAALSVPVRGGSFSADLGIPWLGGRLRVFGMVDVRGFGGRGANLEFVRDGAGGDARRRGRREAAASPKEGDLLAATSLADLIALQGLGSRASISRVRRAFAALLHPDASEASEAAKETAEALAKEVNAALGRAEARFRERPGLDP